MTSARNVRTGLSLLEVILALAILAMSFAAIGELVRTGARNAGGAEDETQAQLLCESKVTEIVAGILAPEPLTQVALDEDPDWVYSVEINETSQAGLVELRVTVERAPDLGERLASFTLVRWMPDPDLAGGSVTNLAAAEANAQNKANAAASGSSGTANSGTAGTSGSSASGGTSGGNISGGSAVGGAGSGGGQPGQGGPGGGSGGPGGGRPGPGGPGGGQGGPGGGREGPGGSGGGTRPGGFGGQGGLGGQSGGTRGGGAPGGGGRGGGR